MRESDGVMAAEHRQGQEFCENETPPLVGRTFHEDCWEMVLKPACALAKKVLQGKQGEVAMPVNAPAKDVVEMGSAVKATPVLGTYLGVLMVRDASVKNPAKAS